MINCKNCKHCNALPALGYAFCAQRKMPMSFPRTTDFCIDFEATVGPKDARTKLEEEHSFKSQDASANVDAR